MYQDVVDGNVMRDVRRRGARAYLVKWRPMVVAINATAVTLIELFDGDTPDPQNIAVVWSSVLVAGAFAAVVLAGLDARRLATFVTFLDLPLLLMWAHSTGRPDPAFATYCGTVAIAAWLLSSRAAVIFGTSAITIVLTYFFAVDQWVDSAVPDVVWTIFGTTVLAAAISRDLERSFTRASHALNQAEDDARTIARSRRRLVADVSHELRTPLTAILGFLDTYLRGDIELDESARHELLLHARDGGVRLERLVDDLIDLERSEHGVMTLVIEAHAIGALVAGAVRAVPAPDQRIVDVRVPPDLHGQTIRVDEVRIGQAIGNCIANAFRHGAGDVRVTCSLPDDALRIDVSDDGPGLPAEMRDQAFEPFASWGNATGSAGLGLAISRSMVHAHGGTIDYVHDDGSGRHAFRIELPVVPASGAGEPGAAAAGVSS